MVIDFRINNDHLCVANRHINYHPIKNGLTMTVHVSLFAMVSIVDQLLQFKQTASRLCFKYTNWILNPTFKHESIHPALLWYCTQLIFWKCNHKSRRLSLRALINQNIILSHNIYFIKKYCLNKHTITQLRSY